MQDLVNLQYKTPAGSLSLQACRRQHLLLSSMQADADSVLCLADRCDVSLQNT